MALNKYGIPPQAANSGLDGLGIPMPQYVALADVAFGGGRDPVVLPHALPSASAYFPTQYFNGMLGLPPSIHVLYDQKRNGIAF